MITRDAMFEPLLAACPTFRPAWEEFVAEWADEEGDLPHYVPLGDLARHVLDLDRAGDEDAVRRVLAVVEAWHTGGDDYVREAATIGFLETLGNNLDRAGVNAERVRLRLGSESRRWWDKLSRFWEGDKDALADEGVGQP